MDGVGGADSLAGVAAGVASHQPAGTVAAGAGIAAGVAGISAGVAGITAGVVLRPPVIERPYLSRPPRWPRLQRLPHTKRTSERGDVVSGAI